MASDLGFVEYVCDQLRDAGRVKYRKMFGEFAVYCDDKVVALVCGGQLFVKPRPHFLIEGDIDDRELLTRLVEVTARELPPPRARK